MENKFVIYSRVSTEHQRNRKGITVSEMESDPNDGYGLRSQQSACRLYVKSIDGEVLKEFVEVQSGAQKDKISFGVAISLQTLIKRRPILIEAINYAREHKATLVFKEISRLTRFKLFGEYIMATDIPFVCADCPNDDKFIISIKIAIAEQEAINTSKKTAAALAYKLKTEGEWRKPNPAFVSGEVGRIGGAKMKEMARKNESNLRAAAMINVRYNAGYSDRAIAEFLNENSFKTSKGNQFYGNTVKAIREMRLTN